MQVIDCKSAKEQGLSKYFTGKPCKRGHVSERRVSDRGCIECSNLAVAKHRAKYPHKDAEIAKAYRLKNPEKVKAAKAARRNQENESARRRYKENAEEMRQRAKAWRKKNPEKVKAAAAKWAEKNKDYLKQKRRERYENNIEQERKAARLRARKTYNERKEYMIPYLRDYYAMNKEAYSERAKLWREANPDKCKQYHANRKSRLRGAEGHHSAADIDRIWQHQSGHCNACACELTKTGFHVDHIVAISKGGTNWPDNLQLLCPACNLSKGDKDFTEWLRSRIAA